MEENTKEVQENSSADLSEPSKASQADSDGEQKPSGDTAPENAYEKLRAAVGDVSRIRFRVRRDNTSDIFIFTVIISALCALEGMITAFDMNRTFQIALVVVLLCGILIAAVAVIIKTVKARRVCYCCYMRKGDKVYCAGYSETKAVVFSDGVAYRIDGNLFYSLDKGAFIDFLDGECAGVYSILASEPDSVECEAENVYFVANRIGGGHTVTVENGKIKRIVSEQPYYTDEVDASTGERKIKTVVYVKSDPTENFEWALPQFVISAFDAAGIPVPEPL